jgi:uncharacterized protein involved in exopolysaccharide biosynthesis
MRSCCTARECWGPSPLGTDAERASEHLSVTASPHSHVIHVTVTGPSADEAARAADAAGAAFVDVRRDTLGALWKDQLRQLRTVIRDQEQLLAQEQTSRLVTSSYDDSFAQILRLRASLDELEEARTQPAEVVRPAEPPTSPDHANTEVPVTSGAMVGLLAGCLLGAARDRVPRRRHQPLSPGTHPRAPGDLPDDTTRHEDSHHAV